MEPNLLWCSVNVGGWKEVLIGVLSQCQVELVLVPALNKRLLELLRREVAKKTDGADKVI